ncbi:hypothetical protein [Rhizobium sp. BK491]|uniref:hypothetical protein n=1 Tax=Rhizobium sp. BK491 TaxID=2587009 RepID=UPI00160C6CA1|nr:hypothetical protein [Rhizobium sp. BK491]MBB3568725.1 hypothetical protein [Rhizobium sp. BK491]
MTSTELDELYGTCDLPARPVAQHELNYRPMSHMTLNDETAAFLKSYMDQAAPVKLYHPSAQTSHILWLIDENGVMHIAVEEIINEDGTLIGVLPKSILARPPKDELRKLGHPSLLPPGQTKARIGGEIGYDPGGHDGREWCLTNESGRFGTCPGRTEAHLQAACGIFEDFDIYLAYEFYSPVN